MLEKDNIEFLVEKIKSGDKELFNKLFEGLKGDLIKMSSGYFVAGGDKGDITSELQIGLWKAIQDYNSSAGMSFKNFSVNVCCKRHLITSVSHANRKKFLIHNNADSLDAPATDDDDSSKADFIHEEGLTIIEKLAMSQAFDSIKDVLFQKLTDLEKSIINEYLKGASYKEIADKLCVKTKTVDNALMRIRKKAQELAESQFFSLEDLF